MLDIVNGDVLTVGGVDHPIRAVAVWTMTNPARSFEVMASVDASTKRAGLSGGQRSLLPKLLGLKIFPFQPVEDDTIAKIPEISSPHKVRQTFVRDDDVVVQLIIEVP